MLTTQAKNISEDFIDFWFNCVRLLNHVKANPRQAFYTRMKSVISDLIGPFSCLSSVNVPHFAVWSLQGSACLWLVGTGGISLKKMKKNTSTTNTVNDTANLTLFKVLNGKLWCVRGSDLTRRYCLISLAAAAPAAAVHVVILTSTLTVHVEVPLAFTMASMALYHSCTYTRVVVKTDPILSAVHVCIPLSPSVR